MDTIGSGSKTSEAVYFNCYVKCWLCMKTLYIIHHVEKDFHIVIPKEVKPCHGSALVFEWEHEQ